MSETEREITNDKAIQLYFHCSLCVKEKVRSDLEAGWTQLGLQIWCRNHEVNIIHVDFGGNQMKANTSRKITEAEHAATVSPS